MTTAAEEKSKKLSEIFPTPKGTKINWYSYFGIIVARDFSVEIQVGTDRVMTTIFSDDQRLLGAYFSFPAYLDEFTFRFNRRTSGSRGKLFYRALQNCVLVKAPPLKDLKSSNPTDKDENFDDIYENHNI